MSEGACLTSLPEYRRDFHMIGNGKKSERWSFTAPTWQPLKCRVGCEAKRIPVTTNVCLLPTHRDLDLQTISRSLRCARTLSLAHIESKHICSLKQTMRRYSAKKDWGTRLRYSEYIGHCVCGLQTPFLSPCPP